ncbi:MAG: hypothetical protein ACRED2_11570, partial [Methylocella sp.]
HIAPKAIYVGICSAAYPPQNYPAKSLPCHKRPKLPPFAPRTARHWVNPGRGQSSSRLPNLTILHLGAKLFNAMDWLFVLAPWAAMA